MHSERQRFRNRNNRNDRHSSAWSNLSHASFPHEVLEQLETVLNMNSSTPLTSPGDTLTSGASHQSPSILEDTSNRNSIQSTENGQLLDGTSNRNSTQSTENFQIHHFMNSTGRNSNEYRVSSIPTNLATNHPSNQSSRHSSMNDYLRNTQNRQQLQSLRSALQSHLHALQQQSITDTYNTQDSNPRPMEPNVENGGNTSNATPNRHLPTAIGSQNFDVGPNGFEPRAFGFEPTAAGAHRNANLEQQYFNRPAIMWNRQVWSISPNRTSRTNFGGGSGNVGGGNRLTLAREATSNSSPDISVMHL